LEIGSTERVALMGRNGAGKSTLLRHAAGLMKPTRGAVQASGRVALLLQNPNDYLVHDTVGAEAPADARVRAGLDPALSKRHPRELSVGEKQRLALAIVLGDPPAPVVCLDEPTRGMDRALKERLAILLHGLDAAVLVATHDPEFAAAFAQRVVLLGDGEIIADGGVHEMLTGGRYFATETARIVPGALTPEQGVSILTRKTVSI
jgi:energy-coupling factor transport system ATP-binding protein